MAQINFRVENISYPPVPTERAEDAKLFAPMVITVSLSFSEYIFHLYLHNLYNETSCIKPPSEVFGLLLLRVI